VEVLHEAEAIGVLICPRSRIAGTVFEGSDRLVPFEIVGWVFAFEIISAWTTEEGLESLEAKCLESMMVRVDLLGSSHLVLP
jgi:hypothetical protein